jgi:hypothetical protein
MNLRKMVTEHEQDSASSNNIVSQISVVSLAGSFCVSCRFAESQSPKWSSRRRNIWLICLSQAFEKAILSIVANRIG